MESLYKVKVNHTELSLSPAIELPALHESIFGEMTRREILKVQNSTMTVGLSMNLEYIRKLVSFPQYIKNKEN